MPSICKSSMALALGARLSSASFSSSPAVRAGQDLGNGIGNLLSSRFVLLLLLSSLLSICGGAGKG